jgi:integrase
MIRQELDDWTNRPATSIRRKDVRELLDEIVDRGAPVLANRVLSLIRKMMNFAIDREWLEVNPHRMPRPSTEQSRTRVLTADELRHVWAWLERPAAEDADDTQRRHLALAQAALKLRLITAQRGGEVIAMRWADVDLTSGWWTIPAEDSKNKLPHRAPLTPMATKILKALQAESTEDAVHVFAGVRAPRHRRGALDGLEVADLRPHDFRRTAASLMAAAGISRLVIAKVLNHVETGVTSIYERHGYDAEKRVALDTWERTFVAILKNKPTTVTPFSKRR